MLSMQHVMCLYEKNQNPSNRLIASTVYPDAIRAYTGLRDSILILERLITVLTRLIWRFRRAWQYNVIRLKLI